MYFLFCVGTNPILCRRFFLVYKWILTFGEGIQLSLAIRNNAPIFECKTLTTFSSNLKYTKIKRILKGRSKKLKKDHDMFWPAILPAPIYILIKLILHVTIFVKFIGKVDPRISFNTYVARN